MRYLTKSRFKQALECPDKLFYSGKKEYADTRNDNEFLRELAKGGMQVGELAKGYFPGGIEVTAPDNTTALKETEKLMQQEDVTLFEAAIAFDNLLVRVDVLVRKGNVLRLYEVKSKSYFNEDELFKVNGEPQAEWVPYLYDIAFQVFVVRKAFPDSVVHGSLMLINKSLPCTVEGLFQKFLVRKIDNRYKVISKPDVSIGKSIFGTIDLDSTIDTILSGSESLLGQLLPFESYVSALAKAYVEDLRLNIPVSKLCKGCEYKATHDHKRNGLKSGYEECWTFKAKFKAEDFVRPHVFDIWNLRKDFISDQRYFMDMLAEADFLKEKTTSKRALAPSLRQWCQVQRAVSPELGSYVDREGLETEFKNLKYPLHFIDFETTRNAIPYIKGLRPYALIAFQFSHHTIDEQGNVKHAGEWINDVPCRYPNFDFIRQLKKQLERDNGSILIYSSFENSVLNEIRNTLTNSNEQDKDVLVDFIRSITWEKEKNKDKVIWSGSRKMTDMREWVLDYYHSPVMKGSNSIKIVLQAILQDSDYLRRTYTDWVQRDESGMIMNPYKLLPPVFDDVERLHVERIMEEDELADGGAAMCAYNLMQYPEMSDDELKMIVKALLKYCKLDTLAMVMLYEGLKNFHFPVLTISR